MVALEGNQRIPETNRSLPLGTKTAFKVTSSCTRLTVTLIITWTLYNMFQLHTKPHGYSNNSHWLTELMQQLVWASHNDVRRFLVSCRCTTVLWALASDVGGRDPPGEDRAQNETSPGRRNQSPWTVKVSKVRWSIIFPSGPKSNLYFCRPIIWLNSTCLVQRTNINCFGFVL